MKSGKCGCLDYDLTQGEDYIHIMNSMVFVSDFIDGYSDDVQREVIATLCNGIANDGDHLQVKTACFAYYDTYILECNTESQVCTPL